MPRQDISSQSQQPLLDHLHFQAGRIRTCCLNSQEAINKNSKREIFMKPAEIECLKSKFIAHCKGERGLSPNTLLAYEQDLNCLAKYWHSQPNSHQFSDKLIMGYLEFLKRVKNHGPASIRRRIFTARSFTNWLKKKI